MGILPRGSGHLASLPALFGLAIAGLFAVSLSGCVSGGASSFADGVSLQDRTASIPAASSGTQEAPLNIASNSATTADAAPTYDEDAIAAAIDGKTQRRRTAGDGADRLAYATDPGQPTTQTLAPVDDPLRRPGEARYASLTPVEAGRSNQLRDVPALSTLPGQFTDPADVAAEARIPALYASIDHGQCKGGWGPKPKMINAERMTPGDPYYMEMRLRHTPPLPVGHVFIAYGRLGPDGQPLDEKLIMLAPIGGYGGAAFAAALPMPGVLKPYGDDCVLRPIAAYRISLSPSKYEKLLLEIKKQKAKKPSYALFAYNCNHFMSDVAKSVGVLPPKNIYSASLTYFYDMMDRNEGRKVPRTIAELEKEQRQQIQLASANRMALQ